MNATLTIRLGEDLAQALEQEAAKSGVSKGEIARQALAARLQARGKPSTLQRHFGVMSGPADLSTNKEYRRTWNKGRS
jgi:hypothetical protein